MKISKTDKAIGRRLKRLRESRGVLQAFVADKLGVSKSHLCELENGKKRWFADLVTRYESLLS